MEHYLYALEVKINKKKLIIIRVNCDKITSLDKLRKSLREGDFKSHVPFGFIQKEDDRWYQVVCEEYKENFVVQVGDANIYFSEEYLKNKVKVISLKKSYIYRIGDGLADLLLTTIYINSTQLKFEHPRKVRSFFNKRSKGILSRRNEVVASEKIEKDYEPNRFFTLHEALSLKAWSLDEETVLLIPFPRYEIRENQFTFPMIDVMKELKEKWSNFLVQNSHSIFLSLEKEMKELQQLLMKLDLIENVDKTNSKVNFGNLNLSDIVLNNEKKSTIKIDIETEAEDIFRLSLREIELPKEDIIVITDSSFNNQMYADIQAFLNDFSNITKSKITLHNKNIVEFLDTFNRKSISKPILFIINSKLSGLNGIYKYIKAKLKTLPHKVLLYKTIHEYCKNSSEDIIFQNYLPLLHRTLGFQPWYTSNMKFNYVLGCVESSRMGGSVSVCASTNFIRNRLEINCSYEYRYKDHFGILKKQIATIFKNKKFKEEDKILILIKKMVLSKPEITGQVLKKENGLNNDIIVSYIDDKEQGRIIKKSSSDLNPIRGAYCNIGENKYLKNYLLITTGFPDISDEKNIGFTRPILTQICKEDIENTDNLTYDDILQMILDLSYMHPTSFSQSRLPLPLHSSIKLQELQPIFEKEQRENIKGVL